MVFCYSPFTVGVASAAPLCNQLETVAYSSGLCNQPENVADTSGSSKTWKDRKIPLFDRCSQTRLEARPPGKTSLKKIGKHFMKILGHFISGGQCITKRGKLTSKQKEIEDHNNKTGNVKCT